VAFNGDATRASRIYGAAMGGSYGPGMAGYLYGRDGRLLLRAGMAGCFCGQGWPAASAGQGWPAASAGGQGRLLLRAAWPAFTGGSAAHPVVGG
jgi:hypothetical protein